MDREATGAYFETHSHGIVCDRCGVPVSHAANYMEAGQPDSGDPREYRTLCDGCARIIEAGDRPIDEDLDELDIS